MRERSCCFTPNMYRYVRLVGAVWLLLGTLGLAARTHAQVAPGPTVTNVRQVPTDFLIDIDDICVLEPGDYDAKTRVFPYRHSEHGKAAKAATIEVDYDDGFTQEAQEAFQRAVDIWATHIESPLTIRVAASFEALDQNVLGSAGPTSIFIATVDGEDIIFGNALVDALSEEDQTPNDPDIVARFNSEADWYFGPPDGPGPAFDEVDFTSVVLHELGHGLGFFGSMTVNENTGEGRWDYSQEVANQGGNPEPWEDVPVIYDQFAVEGGNEDGATLIDAYSNRSVALADALTSHDVFYSGDSTNVAAEYEPGPIPPQLWLPFEWNEGSSYSHLDEQVYETGDVNSLMTPQIDRNEVIHSPGPVTCGMLVDMGWQPGPDCLAFLNVEVVAFEAEAPEPGSAHLTWRETRRADVEDYVIEGRYFDGPFQTVKEIQSDGEGDHEATISQEDLVALRGTAPEERDLPVAGTYAFRLRLIRSGDGEDDAFGETVETTIQLDEPAVVSAVYPNPFADRASVSLTLQSRQRVRVEVYNVAGQRVGVIYDQAHPANDPRPITFDAYRFRDIASGRYFFRVVGRDFSETRSAVFVR